MGWRLFAGLVAMALVLPAGAWAQADLETSIANMARDLSVVMKSKGVKKLAVVDFSDIRGYPSALDGFLAEELITQLMIVAPGDFNIVERRQLSRILEEQKLTSSALFDQDAIANVGKILGLDAIVTGTIADLGNEIKINARSIAIETAQVFAAAAFKVRKEGEVAELLRQTAGPERGAAASSSGATRQVQASDVFFENKLLRVLVAGVGVSPERDRATVSLVVENVSPSDLKLSILKRHTAVGCAGGLMDELGNHSLVSADEVSGIGCTHESVLSTEQREIRRRFGGLEQGPPDEGWPMLASRSRTTLVLPFRAQDPMTGRSAPFGRVFSIGLELLISQNGRIEPLSVGLQNIAAPATAKGSEGTP